MAVLAVLAAVTPLALNMYLPALPEISVQFGVDLPRIQLSLPLFLLGLGVGQLVGAPVSDRHGRRPTALAGVLIFGLATIGILLCQSADRFMLFRLVQGVGTGVATVNIGAVAADLLDTSGAARMFSLVGAVQAVARLVGPIFGRVACERFGLALGLPCPPSVLCDLGKRTVAQASRDGFGRESAQPLPLGPCSPRLSPSLSPIPRAGLRVLSLFLNRLHVCLPYRCGLHLHGVVRCRT